MSAIVFVSQIKPEKNLVEILKYKAYLSPDEQRRIINDLETHTGSITGDDWIVKMHVEIELKRYDTKIIGV